MLLRYATPRVPHRFGDEHWRYARLLPGPKPFRLFVETEQLVRIPLRFFTQPEAMIVAAAASRIFPSDETGPGAQEAGVAVYIDRQLAGPWGRDRYRYTQGPFEENAPAEFGYQGKATPQQVYREGLKDLKSF